MPSLFQGLVVVGGAVSVSGGTSVDGWMRIICGISEGDHGWLHLRALKRLPEQIVGEPGHGLLPALSLLVKRSDNIIRETR